jgi:hypothetical protein
MCICVRKDLAQAIGTLGKCVERSSKKEKTDEVNTYIHKKNMKHTSVSSCMFHVWPHV